MIEFAAKFPNVELRTVEASRSDLFSELASGFVDVAIITGDPLPEEAQAIALWTERLLVALPSSHPLTANNAVHWTDLKNEVFHLSELDSGQDVQSILLSKLASEGQQPKIIPHKASGENIISLVSAGLDVSLVVEASLGA